MAEVKDSVIFQNLITTRLLNGISESELRFAILQLKSVKSNFETENYEKIRLNLDASGRIIGVLK